jgi:hypothetical protein
MKKLLLVLGLFIYTSCTCISLKPEDSKKIEVPQCCIGQDKHTCGMPGMPDKPEQEEKQEN